MMRVSAALLFLVFAPLAAAAQDVIVRSGDHETFTRLVFNLPSRLGWTLEDEANEVRLTFRQKGLVFDTTSVFDRIARDRVSDLIVDPRDNSVTLRLACDCQADGFWFGESMLVVDVAPREQGSAQAPSGGMVQELQSRPEDQGIELPVRNGVTSAKLLQAALSKTQDTAQDSGVVRSNEPVRQSAALQESRDRLLQQLGRAASQGLLSPRPLPLEPSAPNERQVSSEPMSDGAEPSAVPAKTDRRDMRASKPSQNLHINVQTSIDRDFLATLSGQDRGVLSEGCLDPTLLDVASWGTDAPFWEQVGPLRAAMTREFDRTDEGVTRELARRYIFFGFGVEASQVIDLLPQDAQNTDVLRALARIMETGDAKGSLLNAQLDCDMPVSLWSALSHAAFPKDARLEKDEIIRGFSALPMHLRSHLGPLLSKRFLEAGMEHESALILRVLNRVPETKTPAAEMVAADLAMAGGEQREAEQHLASVVEGNGVLSPEALALQIDSQIGRGEDVSFELAQLASAYAFEHAGTPIGAKLARAHILALAASGAFDAAFSELDRLDTDDDIPAIRAEIAKRLASHASEMDFLKHVLSGNVGDIARLPQETALKVAERLIGAGFYDQAQATLARAFNGKAARQARLLRASAALSSERPRQAEVELLGLTGQDANVLRARARSMAGEHKQAYELFRSAGLEEEANREAWLADDWSTRRFDLTEEQSGTANETTASDPEAIGVLAENRTLLEDVVKTRDSLQSLLSAAPIPVAED